MINTRLVAPQWILHVDDDGKVSFKIYLRRGSGTQLTILTVCIRALVSLNSGTSRRPSHLARCPGAWQTCPRGNREAEDIPRLTQHS